jgi:gliding motility-associated-like protein
MPGHGQSLPFACAGSTETYGVLGSPSSVYIWDVVGGTILNDNRNDTIVVLWNSDRGSHSIAVVEQTEYGCYGEPVGASVDVTAPLADIGDNEEVCLNDQFTFDATTSYDPGVSYLWPDGSTGNTYSSGTEGYTWVRITGGDNCIDYDSAYLTINPLPIVDLGRDTALCGTSVLSVDAGFYAGYLWSTGDISNPINVNGERSEPEMLWVEVTDENGCKGSDTLMLEVCDAYVLFRDMPNTITPGDGNDVNDKWEIPNIALFPDALLEIYDRWGRLIYRTDNIADNPWNGNSLSGKEMPMDAYYFILDLRVENVVPLTGYVNVIR